MMIEYNNEFGAVNLFFNLDEASNLLADLNDAIRESKEISVLIKAQNETLMSLSLTPNANDLLHVGKKEVKIKFSAERMEYLLYKLNEFIGTGDFYPSELGGFIRANYSMNEVKEKGLVQVFLMKKRA
jgi:hypothetical protein